MARGELCTDALEGSVSVVNCVNVSVRYGSTQALDSISFELDAGTTTALIGANGAGKTTLMSALCGYMRPTSGAIKVFGEQPGSAKLMGKMAALPQDAAFHPRISICRQLRFLAELQGLKRRDAKLEARRVLELVGLDQQAQKKPEQLSHGMQKRASIAQALIGNPAFVLLDEPTAGLDPGHVKSIRAIIQNLSASATVMVSSHNLEELERVCQAALYLSRGRLIEQTRINPYSDTAYLTVMMENADMEIVCSVCGALSGVLDANVKMPNEMLLKYDANKVPHLDQAVLSVLADRGWHYRRISRGRSLESVFF